jgi:hypothetical protein
MHLRLLTKSLVAATLLFSTLSCAKKEEDAPTPVRGTSSYKLTGRLVKGISLAFVFPDATQKKDRLSIVLSDTPTSQSNTQTVYLVFEKPTTQPSTAYQLVEMSYAPDNTSSYNRVNFANDVTTLQETSPGVFSGTFSGTSIASPVSYILSEGVFTDARL